jgi:glycosyltransferase involved in cell wall biosynthesis
MDESRTTGYSAPKPYEAQSAVLLIGFNRPHETLRVIEKLRQSKPKKIYFAVDGPRKNHPDEELLVKEVRELEFELDWDCSVSTRFLDRNLGCGEAVSTAISWALEGEQNVIILEDDIVPSESFFRFCDELLNLYKDDNDVFAISGCSFVPAERLPKGESYRFSSIPHVWGWAVWKRSWDTYSFDISDWRRDLPIRELHRSLGGSILATLMWARIFDLISAKKIDTWDYQLVYEVLKSKSKVATTNVNTVTNIGFGINSTHTALAPRYLLNSDEVMFPLRHPVKVINLEVDKWTQRNVMGASLVGIIKAGIKTLKR